MPAHLRILLTGATGYVGGRLLRVLEAEGIPLRCLARRPENLAARVADTTEVMPGDLLDRQSLDAAMAGVDVAYYLVHSLGSSGDFEAEERAGAQKVSTSRSIALRPGTSARLRMLAVAAMTVRRI